MPVRGAARAAQLHPRLLALRLQDMQSDCMSRSITIRNVPDETAAELAARAALSGRSLQEYLRARLVALADRPDPEAWVARVRERKASTTAGLTAEEVLSLRDDERR